MSPKIMGFSLDVVEEEGIKGSQRDLKQERTGCAMAGLWEWMWMVFRKKGEPSVDSQWPQEKEASVLQPRGSDFCQYPEWAWKWVVPQSFQIRA